MSNQEINTLPMNDKTETYIDFNEKNPEFFVAEMDERSSLINIVDPEQYLSTKDMIDNIQAGESALDIIGIVESITQNPNKVEKNGHWYTVFNFILKCKDGIQLPVVIWDEEIKRLKPHVCLDYIVHIDAPFAKPQKPSHFSKGRDFMLTCRSNTIINNLGKAKINDGDIKTFVEIDEAIELLASDPEQTIGLNVYIKTEFRVENANYNKMIGAVTDLKKKIVVYVSEYIEKLEFKKGMYIQIFGKMVEKANKYQFEVKNFKQIQKLDGGIEVSEKQLASIINTPKKCNKENENVNVKKLKI